MVEFRGKTVEPFVYLREDGVILTINAETMEEAPVEEFKLPEKSAPLVNPRRFLSQETLMAGSLSLIHIFPNFGVDLFKFRQDAQPNKVTDV